MATVYNFLIREHDTGHVIPSPYKWLRARVPTDCQIDEDTAQEVDDFLIDDRGRYNPE